MELSGGMQQTGAGGSMGSTEQAYLRAELERRHHRLETALKSSSAEPGLAQLLDEVDAALSRMDLGSYGFCDICHDPIERDRLLTDPMVRVCLDDLSGEERRALEDDLALAAKIQRRLLPPEDGLTASWQLSYYYQPARVVSGDYCDYFSSDRDFLFLCGDVSGKGVAASMLMSHLHATFRSLADSDLPLSRMVEAANRLFLESTLAGQFATLVVGRASDEGNVELVSAGHLPVLHVRRDGAFAQGATGSPLGMFSNARFPAHRLHLKAGESLLIYTDGLTETRDADGEEYGMERVREFAFSHCDRDAKTLVGACLENLEQFRSGGKPTDDLTILAVRRL